ncbi:MAG: DUF4159 domain-containing protein [Rhodospirillaceae bacterium]|nr:DUF4159 domain-containing protein [Rhodospirillaceae bacterium]
MLTLGPLVFAQPLYLTALAILPVIYWLLRVTPPAPRRMRFPATRLLMDLLAREETPARTPWWLLVLRLLLAAMVIVALARPLVNPSTDFPGSGPIILVVDNGWASAADWPARRTFMDGVVDRAERQGRRILVMATAHAPSGEPPQVSALLRPAEARAHLEALSPQPWATDRAAALAALDHLAVDGAAHAIWVADGLGDGAATELARRLQQLGSAEVVVANDDGPLLVKPPSLDGSALTVTVERLRATSERTVTVRALAADGRLLARQPALLGEEDLAGQALITLPAELRNEVARLDVEGHVSAGATALLDDRWRRRPVGLVSATAQTAAQPLLADTHYVQRALEPFSELRTGGILDLLDGGIAVLILPDVGQLNADETAAIEAFVAGGGVLVRFAGPLMAVHPDDLVPVRLRLGDRTLSGALSWTEPMPLAPFEPGTPFADLPVPPDVLIGRQVLAEPSLDLSDKTWARLLDGTPLVTAERRGGETGGWVVLVHVTAGPDWSNLPLSGLFVEMLRRMVALSGGLPAGAAAADAGALEPVATLDGFARLETPPPTVAPLLPEDLAQPTIGPAHPPGYYGSEDARRAVNLGSTIPALQPMDAMPGGVAVSGLRQTRELNLMPWLMAAALALMIADLVISLVLRRSMPLPLRMRTGAALAVVLAAWPGIDGARADDDFALTAANDTYLAYVITGDAAVDETSRAGLESLSLVLRSRTAVETAGALGVDIATDELAFFPLLYWPVTDAQAPLSGQTIDRLNAYLSFGGTIVFDTRDQGIGGGIGGGIGSINALRQLTAGLDIPELTPVPPEHVLTKAFYLMQDFPGRYAGGEVWVETTEEHINDGVSSVIIGSNDWAAAWATDAAGQPIYAVVPGGERQREMAYRFGVNLVMYALTGNYKADQVHVPAILERLGQ